jgi:hydroxyacylglutathione hydrolase
MLVERIWAANDLRNFQYLIACSQTGEALAVDPLDARAVPGDCAPARLHDHADSSTRTSTATTRRATRSWCPATGARVLAHAGAARTDRRCGPRAGAWRCHQGWGRTVELEALDTPGHTLTHLCLLAHGDAPALFCGDTLFNAGAGNCHNGGDPNLLYQTFVDQLAKLPEATRVYPGHEYMARNLAFTLDREPGTPTRRARWRRRARTIRPRRVSRRSARRSG